MGLKKKEESGDALTSATIPLTENKSAVFVDAMFSIVWCKC